MKLYRVKKRIEVILEDLMKSEFHGAANIFENIGLAAGQMIRHYHRQIIPRFRPDLNGGGEAFFEYLHK